MFCVSSRRTEANLTNTDNTNELPYPWGESRAVTVAATGKLKRAFCPLGGMRDRGEPTVTQFRSYVRKDSDSGVPRRWLYAVSLRLL